MIHDPQAMVVVAVRLPIFYGKVLCRETRRLFDPCVPSPTQKEPHFSISLSLNQAGTTAVFFAGSCCCTASREMPTQDIGGESMSIVFDNSC